MLVCPSHTRDVRPPYSCGTVLFNYGKTHNNNNNKEKKGSARRVLTPVSCKRGGAPRISVHDRGYLNRDFAE